MRITKQMKRADLQTGLRELVHAKGHRLTPQRQMILDAVRKLNGHCTPDEVFAQVQKISLAVNRATVYRTLEFLLKLGLVTTAHAYDSQVVYELVQHEPHHHLVCQKCKQTVDIGHDYVQPMFKQLEKDFSFHVKTDHLMLFGLCSDCQKS